jgi:hypothetical protein
MERQFLIVLFDESGILVTFTTAYSVANYCTCRYEDAFNRFVEEVNSLAAYQWWEGSVHSILTVLAYPFAWSWQQWRRREKLQRLREYVRSQYDHACLRSCRSRALYEGLKVAATPDLMLAYIDVFLGGDEKRSDLPPNLMQRLPMSIIFGGDGSYLSMYSLHSDNLLTSLLNQVHN